MNLNDNILIIWNLPEWNAFECVNVFVFVFFLMEKFV